MLRCKAQAHRVTPDIEIMTEALQAAKRYRDKVDGPEVHTYDAALQFYSSLMFKLRGSSVGQARQAYDAALVAMQRRSTPHFCLLRVPEHVRIGLANHVQRPQLSPDRTLSRYRSRRTKRFVIGIGAVLISAIALPLIFNALIPFDALKPTFMTVKSMWYFVFALTTGVAAFAAWTHKLLVERRESGVVSPTVLTAADIACWLFLAVAVALFTAGASDLIVADGAAEQNVRPSGRI